MDKLSIFNTDVGLLNAKMAVIATKHTSKILEKYGKITPKLPITVPHTLIYGCAGCHEKDTGILMYDGSIKKVQDIMIGDLVMGPDSNPRKVKKLYQGAEQSYNITTISGESFTVNENHILNLITTKAGNNNISHKKKVGKLINISIKDYLLTNAQFKRYHLLYQPDIITFRETTEKLSIDPYFLGLLLGDGGFDKWAVGLTTGDREVEQEILNFALENNLSLSFNRKNQAKCVTYRFWSMLGPYTNTLINNLKSLNLFDKRSGTKFIPHSYKTSSIENRYKVLAGLLDTDGSYSNGGFDYLSKSKQLANDVIFIAKSLGLRTKLTIKTINYKGKQLEYSRVFISGNCHLIPTKIVRKKAQQRLQVKNPLVFSFKVKPVGIKEYFGFELDQDHLYLTDNFLVHHNSGKTTRAEAMSELMGCSEQDGTFIRLNSDCIEDIQNLVDLLKSKLSWQGYKKDSYGNVLDPVNPIAPIKQILVFLDEVHCLSKITQEKLGLILLDFRYQIKEQGEIKTVYFPRFTLVAATTKPGDLIKPLRTRFGIKISVNQGTDSDMLEVVNTMLKPTGWTIETKAKEIIARMSQGIPREVSNHLIGLYNCWIHSLYTGQTKENKCIMKEIAVKYAKTQKYAIDGLSYDQIRVLKYLTTFISKTGKVGGAGVIKICSALGLDPNQFLDTMEPRLIFRKYITSGARGREITENGLKYLETISKHYPEIVI